MRMPDLVLPPTLLVVALGMLASLGWGVGDFGGGLLSRRAPVFGVLLPACTPASEPADAPSVA